MSLPFRASKRKLSAVPEPEEAALTPSKRLRDDPSTPPVSPALALAAVPSLPAGRRASFGQESVFVDPLVRVRASSATRSVCTNACSQI
jgi:hypothetical protein